MTITSAVQTYSGVSASLKLEKYLREYTETYRVTCSDGTVDPNTILGTTSPIAAPVGSLAGSVTLPVVGTDTYPSDDGALCVGYDLKQNQNIYDITYHYSSNPPIDALRNQDPTARAPIYTFTYQKLQIPVIEDLASFPILNSAGQPFESPVVKDGAMLCIEISKNYATFTTLQADSLINTLNDADWTPTDNPGGDTFAKYSCKMDSLTITPKEENGLNYQEVKYRILYNADLWYPYYILDCGYCQLAGIQLVQMTDKFGNPLQKPALLDDGIKTETPTYLGFDLYKEEDWSALP